MAKLYRAQRYTPPPGTMEYAMRELRESGALLVREMARALFLDRALRSVTRWYVRYWSRR